jgi:surface polysaccharide O-acyltransferase-like enzyme
MISGALFLKVDIPILKIYNKYIKRLFIHLLIWSVIYSYSKIKLSKIDLKKVVNLIIEGHYHLWYLFATIKLYAIIPFSREIARNEKLLKYYIIIFFIFLFLIPNYIYFLSYYSNRISNLLNKIYLKLRFAHSFDNFYFFLDTI